MKVTRQRPIVFLVQVNWRIGNTFESEEGRDEKWSKERR
jgi:hypothetical protein